MSVPKELRTERLLLRRWRPADLEPFAALNSDPRVMEYFPGALSREESDALAASIEAGFDRNGFGLRVLVLQGSPYRRGLTHGRALKKEIGELIKLWKELYIEDSYKIPADQFVTVTRLNLWTK